nr:ERAP1-like C-terminal domain-containing protein [bacterium]
PGCPLVSFACDINSYPAKQTCLQLLQKRFFLDSAQAAVVPKSKSAENLWQIPITFKLLTKNPEKESPNQSTLFTSANEVLDLNGAKKIVLMVNATGNGYFRTNYEQKQLAELQKQNLAESLTVSERVSVLSDLFATSVAGLLPIDLYLQSLEKFAKDQDPYVLGLVISQISELEQLLEPASKSGYQTFVVKCLKPQLDLLGYTRKATDDDLTAELRARLIKTLGTIGNDKQVIAYCREKFEAYLADDKTLDGDLLSPIVQVMAYNGDSDEFVRIEEAWRSSTTPEARNRNLFALAAFRDKECVEKALNLCFNKEVKAQDVPHLLARLIGSSDSQAAAFKFLGDHWQEIYDKVGERKMPDIVEACRNFNKPGQLETLKAFIVAHPMPSGRRSAAKTIEFAAIGTNFKAKQRDSLAQFFAGK